MKRHPNVLWLSVLILGWLFDFLFWKQGPGLNFAVYVLLCLGAGLILARLDQKRVGPGALPLIPMVLFFAAFTFIRAEPLTMGISVMLTLLLMALLAITFVDGDWLRYGLSRYASGVFQLGLNMIIRPLLFNSEVQKERIGSGRPARRANVWGVLRGVLIAIPVVLVFGALLASADIVFGARLQELITFLRLENLPEYIFRLVYILVAAYALAGVLLYAYGYGRGAKPAADAAVSSLTFLGFVEAAIVMGSVLVLFGAFVLVQFRYFFDGQVNIGVQGYTYSEYARRGFGELLAVAFFSLLMIVGLSALTRRQNEIQRRIFSGLAVAIVALVLVMLVSAFQRLVLYEQAYGFSRLRTYTHVFLVWIGLLLIGVAVLELLRLERAFITAAILAAVGFGATLALLNVDAFIVRQNVDRAVRGQGLDVGYLASLSTDSVPALADIFTASSYPDATRDGIGAILACRQRVQPLKTGLDPRSLTLSKLLAEKALTSIRDGLAPYRLADPEWPPKILTPGQVLYVCVDSGY